MMEIDETFYFRPLYPSSDNRIPDPWSFQVQSPQPASLTPTSIEFSDEASSRYNGFADPFVDKIPSEEPVDNDQTADVEMPRSTRTIRHYLPATLCYGQHANVLERINMGPDAAQRAANIYFPFASKEEWELAKFLSGALTQTQIDQFLKMQW
ncbi:hypothetical protein H0H87_000482, partial [Tephrocybe sp. NHM501043]